MEEAISALQLFCQSNKAIKNEFVGGNNSKIKFGSPIDKEFDIHVNIHLKNLSKAYSLGAIYRLLINKPPNINEIIKENDKLIIEKFFNPSNATAAAGAAGLTTPLIIRRRAAHNNNNNNHHGSSLGSVSSTTTSLNFPPQSVSKRDLIDFVDAMADTVLPALEFPNESISKNGNAIQDFFKQAKSIQGKTLREIPTKFTSLHEYLQIFQSLCLEELRGVIMAELNRCVFG